MASLGRLPLPAKCGVLEGISSLECPLFSHSYLPMNSSHSSLQIDCIGGVGGSSLWSFSVSHWGDRILTTDGTIRGAVLLFFCLRLLFTNVPLILIGNASSGLCPMSVSM